MEPGPHRVSPRWSRRSLIAVGLSGIATMARAEGDAPVRGGRLVVAPFPEPALLTYGFDLQPRPLLATSWQTSADGRAITLRSGVTWHDGHPFTSADVACSVTRIWKKYHARGRSTFSSVEAVETPDPATAILRLTKPAPFILAALAATESQVLPRHLYEGQDPLANPLVVAPVGTGPFRCVRWERGGYVLLERYRGYWDQPRPCLDQIVYRFVPDAGGRAAALVSGDVHLVGESGVPGPDSPGAAFSNGSHYADPETDSVPEAAQSETDPNRRHKLYARFQALAQRDLPELPLVTLSQATLSSKRLRGHYCRRGRDRRQFRRRLPGRVRTAARIGPSGD